MAIYVGNLTEREGQYGNYFTGSVKYGDLQNFVNEKGYVKIKIQKRKDVGKYGDTHYIVIDEWQPQNQQTPATGQPVMGQPENSMQGQQFQQPQYQQPVQQPVQQTVQQPAQQMPNGQAIPQSQTDPNDTIPF